MKNSNSEVYVGVMEPNQPLELTQCDTKSDEFQEYFEYCEFCKKQIKEGL